MRYLSADWFSSLVIFVGSLGSIATFWCSRLSSFSTASEPSSFYNLSTLFTPYWVRRAWCTWKNCSCTCSIVCNSPYCLGGFGNFLDLRLYVPLCSPYFSFMSLLLSSWYYALISSWDIFLVVISMGDIGASCTSFSSLVSVLAFVISNYCELPTSSSWTSSWLFVIWVSVGIVCLAVGVSCVSSGYFCCVSGGWSWCWPSVLYS